MQIIEQIVYLEKHIPRYPYLVYNDESVEQLKAFQGQALIINKEMNDILEMINTANLDIEHHENFKENPEEIIEETITSLSIDQLVLLCIKKNGNTNIQEARTIIAKRIKLGEAPQKIYKELIN